MVGFVWCWQGTFILRLNQNRWLSRCCNVTRGNICFADTIANLSHDITPMILLSRRLLVMSSILFAAAAPVASAQNVNYAPGDLVLYFQKEGGSNTVYANIGNTATLYRGSAAGADASNRVNFLNINTKLVAAFGAGWASDPTIYAGLAGVWGTSSSNTTTLQNGDPNRTLYISASRTSVGTVGQASSPGYTVNTNTGMTTGASAITQQNNVLEVNYAEAIVVSPVGTSNIDEQNPFSFPGTQGTGFGIFGGGVQQQGAATTFGSFGGAGTVEFALDLYRILASNTAPAQVAGVVREGSFEGTVTINSSGQVSFIAQGAAPASSFSTWSLTFPALDTAAKRLATADPDNDGVTNLMEFVLDGNPGSADNSTILPTINAAGSSFLFSFKRRDDSEAGAAVMFQYSSDFSTWTSAAVGAGGGTSGNATIVVNENGSNADLITVSVPKSVAANGRLFGRIRVSQ
jgi:hypothetical protein